VPAEQRGWVRKRKNGWQVCWRERNKQRTGPHLFASKTEARAWLNDNLDGGVPIIRGRGVTFGEHVERYLRVHGATVDPTTIRTLQERLGASTAGQPRSRSYKTAVEAFGSVTLADFEHMSAEIAEWQATLPPRYRYAIMRSLRQALQAAVRWKLMRENPAQGAGANPQPRREEVAFFASLARRCLRANRRLRS
jgi:hypothetical protein